MVKRIFVACIALLTVICSYAQSDSTQKFNKSDRPIYFDFAKGVGNDMVGGEIGIKYVTLGCIVSKNEYTMFKDDNHYYDYDEKRMVEGMIGCMFTSGKDRNALIIINPSVSICNYKWKSGVMQDSPSAKFNICGGVAMKHFNFQVGINHLFKENALIMKFGVNVYGKRQSQKEEYNNYMKDKYNW